MTIESVFEETNKLNNEMMDIEQKIKELNFKYNEIKKICPHEIVFKYNDNHPRKLLIEGSYICPACGKIVSNSLRNEIEETDFNNSRIIPLTNLSLMGTKKVLMAIRDEVYKNMEFYYNSNNSIEELSSKMEEVLKEMQYDYKTKKLEIIMKK